MCLPSSYFFLAQSQKNGLDQPNSEVQNNEEKPCRLTAFEVIYWFPSSQCKSRRLGVKDAFSALPENKMVVLQTAELANGNTCVIPAALYL